jgi:putative two-component system hydrogenase maturation factor HypX/HoxX
LFGSEYWTYLLPRRVGSEQSLQLTNTCLPISAAKAKAVGLVDHVFGRDVPGFRRKVSQLAEAVALSDDLDERLRRKRAARQHDERTRPLSSYRFVELTRMRHDFASVAFESARSNFVHKIPRVPFTHPAAVRSIIRSADAQRPAASVQHEALAS